MTNQMIGTPGYEYFANGNTYQANGSGLITGGTNSQGSFSGIMPGDVVPLMNGGAHVATLRARWINFGIVKAASAAAVVASAALSNGSLGAITQPDIPRQLQGVVIPGAAAITAGALTLVYNNTQGVASTDTISLVTGSGVNLTFTTSQGCARLTSAIVAGLVGGSTPTVELGTNTVLALPADVGQSGLAVYKAVVDDADDTLPTQSASDGHLVTPNTAPNGTHTFSFGINFFAI